MNSPTLFVLNPDSTAIDLATELFIVSLLEHDLEELRSRKIAEAPQNQVMALDKDDDAEMGREVLHIDFSQEPPYDDDLDAALNLFVKDARVSSDSIFAASFQQSAVARLISDQQYAQGVNAREIGCALDYEYARRLGEMEEQGNPASNDSDVEQ